MLDLLVDGLAVWRLSRMLVQETGPLGAFTRLREATGIEHDADGNIAVWPLSTPLGCVLCTSVWAAPLVLVLPRFVRRAFAVSGVAILIEKML